MAPETDPPGVRELAIMAHRDPFDRALSAQAVTEPMYLLTGDQHQALASFSANWRSSPE
jgi:PIN domain nuclease of toxin-antitoxin system